MLGPLVEQFDGFGVEGDHPFGSEFAERDTQPGAARFEVDDAVEFEVEELADASLTDTTGRPLHVTLHQLRHTFGTSLELSTVALGASFGGVEYRASVWAAGFDVVA